MDNHIPLPDTLQRRTILALNDLGQAVTASLRLDEVFARALNEVMTLLESDGAAILIDPFFTGNPAFEGDVAAISNGISHIVVTHGHGDHVGDTLDIAARTGATVITNQREIAADDFFVGMYTTALEEGEIITAIRFPIPKRAAYLKFKQAASRFSLVGVFVAQTDTGVRVAITGAASSVFRHTGLEAALNQSFTPQSAASVKIDASDLNADIHASAAYRANLISVQTQRAVQQMLA